MKKKIIISLMLISMVLVLISNVSANDWIIEGDKVYREDTNVYLSAEPHTIGCSGWVMFNVTSKVYSGDIDVIWGFNTTETQPKRTNLFRPHWVNWTTDHLQFFLNVTDIKLSTDSCDFGNEYNTYKRNVSYYVCSEWNETIMECEVYNLTSSVLCFDSYEQAGNNYTIGWDTKHSRIDNWLDITHKFSSFDYEYQNMTKWYYVTDVSVVAGNSYQVRAWIDVPVTLEGSNGKYWWAIKPSSETIAQAISNNHFYCLDPWWSSSWNKKRAVSVNNTAGSALTDYQVYVDLTDNPINETSLRVVNETSDTIRPHWCENISGGDCTAIYVNYSSIAASTWTNDTSIYYDNDAASSTSNMTTTFLSSDDFEGQTLSAVPTGWTENYKADMDITSTAKNGTRGAYLRFTGSTTDVAVTHRNISNMTGNNDREIHFWSQSYLTTGRAYIRISDGTGWLDAGIFLGYRETGNIEYYDGSSWHSLRSYSSETWYKFRIYNIDLTNNQFDLDIAGTNEGTNLNMVGTPSFLKYLMLEIPQAKPASHNHIDTFLLKKSVSNEPTITIGNEETESECTPPAISSLTNSTAGVYNVTITWSNNQSSDCKVKYSDQSDLSSHLWSTWDNDTSSVSINLTTLNDNSKYYYQAWAYNGTDSSCNTTEPVSSPYKNFTTAIETATNFTIVILPDTQYYSESYPAIFTNQTQWIVDNVNTLNIRFVLHVGDLVQTGSSSIQWNNANTSMNLLDNNVSYMTIPGNHDYDDLCAASPRDVDMYNTYFGTSRFTGYDWYYGNYPTDSNQNNYALFTYNTQGFLIIGLEFCPSNETLAWANNLLNTYSDRKTIIYTHVYMNHDDTRVETGDDYNCDSYGCCGDCNNGNYMWDKMVSNHSNIVLVTSGHILGDGLGKRTDYVSNYPVNQILQNYQMHSNGGNGYLRYYTFKPEDNEIQAKTYSPYLKSFNTGSDNEFVLPYTAFNKTPPDPVNLQNTSGNYWVNYTWSAGTPGNITNSYNVSWNSTWYNDTSVTYMNDTIPVGGWANITVYAYNSSADGTLSSGSVSDEVKVSDAPEDYIPPNPTTLANSTGNFWINHTYIMGTPGNVTDSYNVSIGAVWHNTTTVTYHNDTGLSAHDWSNVTVWAYNTSGSGTLSAGSISDNVRIPNNAVTLTVTQNYEKVETETVFISDTSSSDTDSDTPTYSCNRTDLFADFSTSTGYGNWTTGITDSGTYYVDIGVSDGWGSTDNKTLTITIYDATPGTPSNLANSTGNFWVNHTWNIGTNTDTFNISVNSTWTNDTSNEYYNNTNMIPHNWSNITVYGFNSTSDELSGSTSQNTQISNNVPVLTGLPDNTTDEDINQTDIFDLDDYFTDVDSDTPTYLVESNNQSAYVSVTINASNNVSYTLASGWNGTAEIVINVTDGWGGEDNDTFLIIVNAAPLPGDYIPGNPTNLQNTSGNYWVNYTWSAGTPGNITNSYNVSWNSTWYNDTSVTYMNDTIPVGGWANITVYAFNSSGNGTLSTGYVSDEVKVSDAPSDYIPPDPTNLQNTTGNGWVNHTWSMGTPGNVTDSYNVSWNSTWYNTTLVVYMNDTVGEFGWANITVWAYNSSGNGSLSSGNVTDNTRAGGGTFITNMNTGVWNLVSFYNSTNGTAEIFGNDITNVDYIAMYNGSFYTHTMGMGLNNFTTVHGMSYFVFLNASGSSTYTRNTIPDGFYNTSIYNRWNTIGWTNATATDAFGLTDTIGVDCNFAAKLKTDGINHTTYTRGFIGNRFTVDRGYGYWAWNSNDTVWGRNS